MAKDIVSETSKTLSWLLRHAATAEGLTMDEAGWVPVDQVLRRLRISRDLLDRVVEENNKGRLEVVGERVRACQGHSRQGLPLSLDALEASWARHAGPGSLWHGTNVEAARSIAAQGILAGERTHVHLAAALDSKVGKRAGVDVMIEVSVEGLRAAGRGVFVSPNGVVLVRDVPPSCLVGLVGCTRRGQAEEGALRSLLRGGPSGGEARRAG
jgi:putative RNA 2'-phosphotransferase